MDGACSTGASDSGVWGFCGWRSADTDCAIAAPGAAVSGMDSVSSSSDDVADSDVESSSEESRCGSARATVTPAPLRALPECISPEGIDIDSVPSLLRCGWSRFNGRSGGRLVDPMLRVEGTKCG